MTGKDRQCDDWKPCPLGLLVQAARGDRAKVSRRKLLRAGGTAAAVLLGGSLGWRAWRSSRQEIATEGTTGTEVVARMSCDEAIPLIPALVSNELPEGIRRRVEAHLAHCPHCASLRNDLRPKA